MKGATNSQNSPYLASRPIALGLAKVVFLLFAQLPLTSALPTPFTGLSHHGLWPADEGGDLEPKPADDPSLWLYLGVAIALVLGGGAFAGLTIALMGQDEIYLQVIKSSGEGSEKKNAAAVLNLLQKGKHWVLVTLLLSNVITNETLPIVLDRSLGGGWPAVVGSTVLIVIFGEIVPQSICVRYGLPIGAWMAPCVLVLMYIMSPIAWPVAKLLDYLLGKDHGTIYKKAGLKTLVTLHKTLGDAGEQLNSDEVTIISACLDLKEKSVGSIMTPMEDVFTMSADTVLDEATMDLILSQGYSRIPIHAPENEMNFVGMLLVKMLITYDPEDCKLVRDFPLATLPETRPETSCLDIVNFFQEGKSHMVLVSDFPGEDHGALGVVTLEDVIEELIGEEIIDESDVFIDVHKAIRRLAPAPKSRVPKGRIVEDPPSLATKSQEDNLIDLSSGTAMSPSVYSGPRRWSGAINQPLPPKFLLRNRNGAMDPGAPNEPITKRGTDEIREHLKHLGPSNLASRPRQTRYQNVKIKAPGASPARSGYARSDDGRRMSAEQRRRSEPTSYQGDMGAGLVTSAARDASDGVQSVQYGYGTMGRRSTQIPANSDDFPQQATKSTQATLDGPPQIVVPEAIEEDERDVPQPLPTSPYRSPNRSQPDSIHSHEHRFTRHSGPARSGSITEQIIDVNGVRKVVLQTTSSSSSLSEAERLSPTSKHRPSNGHSYVLDGTSDASRKNETSGGEDDEDDHEADGNEADESRPLGGLISRMSGGGKKKRRRRKKKSQPTDDHSAEGQPLLK